MDDRVGSSHVVTDAGDLMDMMSAAEIKEELLDDDQFDAYNVGSRLSDIEGLSDVEDDDVIIVDAEKTMQYLSGFVCVGYHYK